MRYEEFSWRHWMTEIPIHWEISGFSCADASSHLLICLFLSFSSINNQISLFPGVPFFQLCFPFLLSTIQEYILGRGWNLKVTLFGWTNDRISPRMKFMGFCVHEIKGHLNSCKILYLNHLYWSLVI